MPTVMVTVTKDGIVVKPNPVYVRKGQRNVLITWCMNTRGWKFTRHGIVIGRNNRQFHAAEGGGSRTFRWLDRNNVKAYYKYTVNITNDTTTASRDPGIHNGGH